VFSYVRKLIVDVGGDVVTRYLLFLWLSQEISIAHFKRVLSVTPRRM